MTTIKHHTKGRRVPPAPTLDISIATRDTLARIAHEAVCEADQSDGSHFCLGYAWAGFILLQELGIAKSAVNVGSLYVEAGCDALGPYGYHMLATDPATRGIEFHAWNVVELASGQYIGIDFSARHYKAWAKRLGIEWQRKDLPLYLWGTLDEWQHWRVVPQADQELTEIATHHFTTERREIASAIAQHCLLALKREAVR
jgi:hypothetical protein